MYFKETLNKIMGEHYYSRPKSATRTLFNLSVISFFLLIGFSIFYYLVIFLPSKEQAKVDLQKQEQQAKTTQAVKNSLLLQQCLDDVNKKVSDPKFTAAIKGVKVNSPEAKVVLDLINQQKEECYKKYPQ